ncbi:MAG: response regulator [Candidatus Aureabacteria bacterium]|nr:response regulator [Candidatus Auribacterota bacterium]
MKILIVDDEKVIRDSLSDFLEKAGHSVETTENAVKALYVFEKGLIDVCIMDIRMPGIDGVELLEKTKASYPDTYYIMITGHGDMNDAVNCLKLGAYNYLRKPVNLDELISNLERIEQKEKMKKELEEHREKMNFSEKIAAIGTLATGFAHSVNNPLAFLKGNYEQLNKLCSLMQKSFNNNGDAKDKKKIEFLLKEMPEILESSIKAIDRIKEIQKQIFSVREGIKTDETINIYDIINQSFEHVCKKNFAGHDISLRLQAEVEKKLTVCGSKSALLNIFVVLMSNSIEAIANLKDQQITVQCDKNSNGSIELTYFDSGNGIPPYIGESIFTPFFTTKGDHQGIGLYFAYWLAKQIKGDLQIKYNEKGLSRFVLTLLKQKKSEDRGQTPEKSKSKKTKTKK